MIFECLIRDIKQYFVKSGEHHGTTLCRKHHGTTLCGGAPWYQLLWGSTMVPPFVGSTMVPPFVRNSFMLNHCALASSEIVCLEATDALLKP